MHIVNFQSAKNGLYCLKHYASLLCYILLWIENKPSLLLIKCKLC